MLRFTRSAPSGSKFRIVLGLWIAVCVIGLIRDQIRINSLADDSVRLEKLVGRLNVENPELLHARLIASDPGKMLLWRIYVPAESEWRFENRSIGGSGWRRIDSSTPIDDLVRWQIISEKDHFMHEILHRGGSSRTTVPDRMIQFIENHWSEFDISIAGEKEQATVAPGEIMTVLSVSMPESLSQQAETVLGNYTAKKLKSNPVFEIRLGPIKAFEKEQAATQKRARQ